MDNVFLLCWGFGFNEEAGEAFSFLEGDTVLVSSTCMVEGFDPLFDCCSCSKSLSDWES